VTGPRAQAERLAASALGDSMMTLRDVAAHLGVSVPTTKRWRADGVLPPADFAHGGIVRWSSRTIGRWIADHGEARR